MMDLDFKIEFEEFFKGFAPLAHVDTKTFVGDRGQASEMLADIITKPGFITQSPALANLTNGTQAGVVGELIQAILEPTVDDTYTYALGKTKLYKLSATTVISGGSPSWPQTVTTMAEGCSLVRLGAYVFGFYNTATDGDILALTIATGAIDNDWGSTTDTDLELAPHPSAVKEDIMLFGNGQYVGSYIAGLGTLNVQHLDFGAGAEIADVLFHSNYWWIAVNYGDRRSQIYMYDGSALSNILSDESGVGNQKIGFMYVLNGVIYVTYTDSTSGGFVIGYLSGKSIKALRYFAGTLPDYRQKTLYRNTILFISNGYVMSMGASVEQLPAQISRLADGGYATVGALSAPFGIPLVASTDGTTNHRLAKFSGFALNADAWKTIFVDITNGRHIGHVSSIIVYTKPLHADASAVITLEGNQGEQTTTDTFTISGENVTRHVFDNVDLADCEDVRAIIDYSGSDATNDCPIRKIVLLGNYVER